MPSFEWSEWISTTDLMFFAGVLLAVMAMMRMARLRAMRREEPYRPQVDRAAMLARQQAPAEREPELRGVAAPSSPIEERAAEALHRLENRVRTLEELLRAADRKIVELNALLKSEAPPPRAKRGLAADIAATPAHHQAESLARSREFAARAGGVVAGESRRTTARYQEVYRLLDQGDSAATVARKLGFPVGEVELIAGLRG